MKGTDTMTTAKTIFTPVTPELTPSQILTLFYGYQAGLLRAWDPGADPAPFFGEVLGIRTREEYVAFREELRSTLRRLGEVQAGLARRTRIPGGDPEAQTRRAQLRPLVTTLIAMRRAGKAWAGARAKSRCTQAA
jgi:hypothetical protein